MAVFSKMKRSISVALSLLLGCCLLPAQAFAVDGATATEEDAALDDAAATLSEADDSASSWRYRDGDPLQLDEGVTSSDELDPYAASTFALTQPAAISWPSNIVIPSNATSLGIDVSYHNGTINWKGVKDAGVEFAIIRCGYGKNIKSQDDKQWQNNVKGARDNGIAIGVYLYSYANTVAGAREEAEHTLRLLKEAGLGPNDLAFPVYYDLEESCFESTKQSPILAEMAYAFCSKISEAGYTPGIYSNTNWFTNYVTYPVFDAWGRWVAQYNSVCKYNKGAYQMWQFTSDGRIGDTMTGNSHRVDLNFALGTTNGRPDAATGFRMESGRMYYYTASGVRATGWQSIGGKEYYFDKNGVMVTGSQTGVKSANGTSLVFSDAGDLEGYWYKSGSSWYLRNQNDKPKTGWQYVQGKWYYLNGSTGAMQTGWLQQGKSWYYLNSSGAMTTGWLETGGAKYYLSPVTGVMYTGTQTISGKQYIFDSSGAFIAEGSVPSASNATWAYSGGKWYLKSGGQNLTGWQKVSGTWYYFDAAGVMQTGWLNVSGTWYLLNSSGAMLTGWQMAGGKWFYFNTSGAMLTGWQKVGGKWYLLNASGAMLTGWQKVSGTWYLLNSSGAMLTGWQKTGGKWYYLTGSGAMATGWQKVGGTWYLLNGSGAMLTGWQKADGVWYYLNSAGAMQANKWIGNYYLLGSGAMAENQWIGSYYVGSDGKWIPSYRR